MVDRVLSNEHSLAWGWSELERGVLGGGRSSDSSPSPPGAPTPTWCFVCPLEEKHWRGIPPRALGEAGLRGEPREPRDPLQPPLHPHSPSPALARVTASPPPTDRLNPGAAASLKWGRAPPGPAPLARRLEAGRGRRGPPPPPPRFLRRMEGRMEEGGGSRGADRTPLCDFRKSTPIPGACSPFCKIKGIRRGMIKGLFQPRPLLGPGRGEWGRLWGPGASIGVSHPAPPPAPRLGLGPRRPKPHVWGTHCGASAPPPREGRAGPPAASRGSGSPRGPSARSPCCSHSGA